MALLGIAIERTVLRPLVNQPPITLFMATLGLAYVVEGGAQLLWGAQVHGLDLGVERHAVRRLRRVRLASSICSPRRSRRLMVAALIAFFQYTRIGLAFRAVAADQLRRRRDRPAPAADLGHRLDRRRLRRAGRRACCGARGSACSSRCRSSC